MSGIEVLPLEDDQLDAAAKVLADRHRRHRQAEPLLPKVTEFKAQLERDLEHEGAAGVVAIRGDEVVAYVIGRLEPDARLGDVRAIVDFAGCAAAAGEAEAVRDLYAALAARWIAAGATRHLALIPASDEALTDPWLRLAFGVQYVWAVRETAPMKPVDANVKIRPGTPDDLELVAKLDRSLYEHQAQSPSFSGLAIPGDDEFRADWSDLWDDSELYTHFVAERDGVGIGHVVLYRRPTGDLRVPENNIDLSHAATLPSARRTGVNVALMAHALTWAHEHGFHSMTTDWRSANLLSSRHWPRLAFRPTYYRLYRALP
jgi:GNAT superfamily N-acetyltransferase